ncbi:UNVERIFIED_CONTAM: hypothetical protein K2H54_042215 [Gekko kuhli]
MISGPPQKRRRHLRQITDKELRRIDERKYSGLAVSPSGPAATSEPPLPPPPPHLPAASRVSDTFSPDWVHEGH